MEKKKIKIYSEAAYLPAIIIIAFAVSLTAIADYGVSTIVAPAYILSLKFSHLTFGLAEYIVQGLLFILFCIIMKKVKLVYFTSFLTGIIYGFILDTMRALIPFINPDIMVSENMQTWLRIVYLAAGMVLTSFSVAMFFKIYIYPQVYDFFAKGMIEIKKVPTARFKTGFDLCLLGVSLILSFSFFGKLNGIGVGTVVMSLLNGTLIGLFDRFFDKYFVFEPYFKKFGKLFDL